MSAKRSAKNYHAMMQLAAPTKEHNMTANDARYHVDIASVTKGYSAQSFLVARLLDAATQIPSIASDVKSTVEVLFVRLVIHTKIAQHHPNDVRCDLQS